MAEEDWNSAPLTEIQISMISELMKVNPDADQLYVESVVRLGTGQPDKLKEIVDKMKTREKTKPVRLTEDELRIKCVDVFDEEGNKV
jgi:hypothetical protein